MSYIAQTNKFKVSCFILNLQDDNDYQENTTAAYVTVDLKSDNSYRTEVNGHNITLSISSNIVTLPSGKYYLDARLNIGKSSSTNWEGVYKWFEWDGSSKTTIGYEGAEIGKKPDESGFDIRGEHAKAYIESDGTKQIGLEFVDESGTVRVYPDKSRVMIWKLE